MKAITLLEKIISPEILGSDLLLRELTFIPVRGATAAEIREEESEVGHPFSEAYRQFLLRWNGINLDVIRLYGAGKVDSRLHRLVKEQIPELPHMVVIGSDPAGFIYAENSNGAIYSLDHDGGELKCVAQGFESFIVDYVFGKNSAEFGGEEWLAEVMAKLRSEA
jgi:hypothetical protein